jgi:hypothetical protein
MPAYTKTTPGKPTSGKYAFGDTVTDSTGVIWECVRAGIPGEWLGQRRSPAANEGTPASYATAGAQTYSAADILSGIIVRDCAGAGRSDVLPTAALLVAAVTGAQVGDELQCIIVNGSDAAETLTIGAGTGGAFDANQTVASRVIPQNASKVLTIRLTNVSTGTQAYVAYL